MACGKRRLPNGCSALVAADQVRMTPSTSSAGAVIQRLPISVSLDLASAIAHQSPRAAAATHTEFSDGPPPVQGNNVAHSFFRKTALFRQRKELVATKLLRLFG